jgi:hypothetical protein
MMATISGLAHCVVMKSVAETDSSLDTNEPGMTKMSNCGASANEFYLESQSMSLQHDERREDGACGNLYLPARISQLGLQAKLDHGNPA